MNKTTNPAVNAAAISTLSMNIDGGKTTTKQRVVQVTLKGIAISHYRLSEDRNFTNVAYEVYPNTAIPFTLSEGGGTKTIYAQVKSLGVELKIISASITLIPTEEFKLLMNINDGDNATFSRNVTVNLRSRKLSNYYRLSERYDFADTEWIIKSAGSTSMPFTLSEETGKKRIYAQVKAMGVESEVISSTIYYKTGTDNEFGLEALVNNGLTSTESRNVSVKIEAKTPWNTYRISENYDFDGASWITVPEGLNGEFSHELTEAVEMKRIYIQVGNGQRVSEVITRTIDYAGPIRVTAMSLNDGAESTPIHAIMVRITASSVPVWYMISHSPYFDDGCAWEDWNSTSTSLQASFILGDPNGLKTIYVKVRGNSSRSEAVSAQITLAVPPIDADLTINGGENSTSDSRATLLLRASRTFTHYRIDIHEDLSRTPWVPYTGTEVSVSRTLEVGLNKFYAQVRDDEAISPIDRAGITFNVPADHALLALGYDWTAGQNIGVSYYDAATGFNKVRIDDHDYTKVYDLYDTAGSVIGNFTLDGLREAGTYFVGNVTGNDSGIYPDMAIHFAAWKPGDSQMGTITLNVPAGNWKVKALVNIVSHGLDFSQAIYELQTAGSENKRFTLPPSFDNNFTQTMDQTITVQQGQPLYLKMHTPDVDNSVLFLNCLELIRA